MATTSRQSTRRQRRPRIIRGPGIALVYLLVSWGVIATLANGLVPYAPAIVAAVALYVTVPLIAYIVRGGWPFYPRAAFRILVVRVVLYAQLLLPFVAGAGLVGAIVGAPFGHALVAGRIAALATLVVAGATLVAGYLGSRQLVVRELDAEVPGLPPEFDGLRIAQISDLHVGPHSNRRFLRRVVASVRALEPDLIAVTGDLVDDRSEDVASYARALGELHAPLGIYIIPGNHDVYAGWDAVRSGLERAAPTSHILVNDVHLIERDGARLALLGTGDPAGRHGRAAPDVDRAFARVPDDTTVIAFAHNPALWPALAERGAALTLSGHTHWGQFALPRHGWSLASPFLEHAMGAYREGDALLYIHPGTGYWGIPFRIGAPSEVALITLRAAREARLDLRAARRAA